MRHEARAQRRQGHRRTRNEVDPVLERVVAFKKRPSRNTVTWTSSLAIRPNAQMLWHGGAIACIKVE